MKHFQSPISNLQSAVLVALLLCCCTAPAQLTTNAPGFAGLSYTANTNYSRTNATGSYLANTNYSRTNATAGYLFNTNFSRTNATGSYGFATNYSRTNATGGYGFVTNYARTNVTGAGGFTANAPGTLDMDARDFVLRAGLTNATQITAVFQLTSDLKGAGLWSRIYAFYPLVGGNSNSCAQNLISTNYQVTWQKQWIEYNPTDYVWSWQSPTNITFASSGVSVNTNISAVIAGDGSTNLVTPTSIVGNTHLNLYGANYTNSFHLFCWVGKIRSVDYGPTFIGNSSGTRLGLGIGPIPGITAGSRLFWGSYVYDTNNPSTNGGPYMASVTGGTQYFLTSTANVSLPQDGATEYYGTPDPVNIPQNTNQWVSFLKGYGVNQSYVEFRAVSIGQGFTPAQATNYFAIVQRFETALGRGTP